MLRQVLKSKIQNAIIKKIELYYEGSIGIDEGLLELADIVEGERVQVLNFYNGMRFETYVIKEPKHSGLISLYGPAARCGQLQDKICILSYCIINNEELKNWKPKIILVDNNNKPI